MANDLVPAAAAAPPAPAQADSDAHLVALWLHGRGPNTARAYRRDVGRFLEHLAGRPLRLATVGDLQAFTDGLADLAPRSRGRTVSAVKSLLTYGHRLGYLSFNVGGAVQLPPAHGVTAERILDEAAVHRMIALTPAGRDRTMIRLLYAAGVRVSELIGLHWRDARPRDDAGQVTVTGKGGKVRAVLLTAGTWAELAELRGAGADDAPVFRSRKGGALGAPMVHRIVRAAARRAGINADVSPHWLRHAHASHALDRGAPIHLVQTTLGHASVSTTSRYLHARPNDGSARYLAV